MSPELMDLLFTSAAIASLGTLLVCAAAVLPWREHELDEVSADLGRLLGRAAARPVEALRRAA